MACELQGGSSTGQQHLSLAAVALLAQIIIVVPITPRLVARISVVSIRGFVRANRRILSSADLA